MKVVVQRVSQAAVRVEDAEISRIGKGLLILLGVAEGDTVQDAMWLVGKVARLRIFADQTHDMNCSVVEVGGEALVVSQFTLQASTKKGNRPSFIGAAQPDIAMQLYEYFVQQLSVEIGRRVPTGRFGNHMQVSLVNDGPVTIVIDSTLRE